MSTHREKREPAEVLLDRLRRIPAGEQGRVAELAGITPAHLSRWLNEEVPLNPKLETLRRLAAALEEPLVSLVDDGRPAPAPPPVIDRATVASAIGHLDEARRLLASAQEAEEVARLARAGAERTSPKGRTRAKRGVG